MLMLAVGAGQGAPVRIQARAYEPNIMAEKGQQVRNLVSQYHITGPFCGRCHAHEKQQSETGRAC